MKKQLRVGKKYFCRENKKLWRIILLLEFEDWFNEYRVHYVTQDKVKDSCLEHSFRRWAEKIPQTFLDG